MGRPMRFANGVSQVMIRLPKEQYEALMAISERDGVPIAEQFRRAVALYLTKQGKVGPRGTKTLIARAAKAIQLAPRYAQEDR